ncbi:MAG: SDR family NAD(P)-dependent oxidoreductase, partial [Eggerthellaceae bacterium]
MGVLDGKVAIVTGSGQGIGRGIAIGLAREGAIVITNNRKKGTFSAAAYDKDSMPAEDYEQLIALSGDAEATVAMIEEEGGKALAVYGDVAKPEDADCLVQAAIDNFGRIDILVNNAGGTGSGSIESLDEATWDKLTLAKTKGAFNTMHAAVPYMREQGYGRIFNCSSDAWVGLVDNDAYSAGNAGAVGLTWASAKELYRYGITVNAYCPQGASPAHAVEYNKMLRNVKAMTGQDPDPRLLAIVEADHGDPANLGPFFAYLCTEEAGNISGEVFAIKSSGRFSRYEYPQPIASIEPAPGKGPKW